MSTFYSPVRDAAEPLLSDAAVKLIVDAGLAMALIFLFALGIWTIVRPLVARLIMRDKGIDSVTQAFIDESRASREDAKAAREDAKVAHEDNSRLIAVIEQGREEDRLMRESIQSLTGSIQQSNATTLKLVDVAMGHIQKSQQDTERLPIVLEAQRKLSVEEVITAMDRGFELSDKKFTQVMESIQLLQTRLAANEKVSEDIKSMVSEALDILKSARPVEHKGDTGPLPPLDVNIVGVPGNPPTPAISPVVEQDKDVKSPL